MAQAMAGQQTKATATLQTAVNLAPSMPTPKLHLAELYMALGKRKEAASLIQSIDRKKIGAKDQEALARLTDRLGA
jgi:predicted Zn-dependent protease